MAIEEVFVPVRTISGVGQLRVQAHNCREELGEGEDE